MKVIFETMLRQCTVFFKKKYTEFLLLLKIFPTLCNGFTKMLVTHNSILIYFLVSIGAMQLSLQTSLEERLTHDHTTTHTEAL